MSKIQYFTNEGLKKLREELHQLVSVERPSISQQIAEARDKGDISENAEYEAAKDAQGLLEMKILKIQDILSNARIIDEATVDTSKVLIFTTVTLKNTKNNSIMTYKIVTESEADIKSGKISITSPIAKGLLGKHVGDKVEIQIPAGQVCFEIIEISGIK